MKAFSNHTNQIEFKHCYGLMSDEDGVYEYDDQPPTRLMSKEEKNKLVIIVVQKVFNITFLLIWSESE